MLLRWNLFHRAASFARSSTPYSRLCQHLLAFLVTNAALTGRERSGAWLEGVRTEVFRIGTKRGAPSTWQVANDTKNLVGGIVARIKASATTAGSATSCSPPAGTVMLKWLVLRRINSFGTLHRLHPISHYQTQQSFEFPTLSPLYSARAQLSPGYFSPLPRSNCEKYKLPRKSRKDIVHP